MEVEPFSCRVVFKLFTKHHCGILEERIETVPAGSKKLVHSNRTFWDNWEPSKRYPPYRRILTRVLIDNPRILELSTRTRFRKLIHQPWQALRESHPQYFNPPPVFILAWDSQRDGKELLRSIYELDSPPHSSSLLWIISTDNIKLPIQDLLHPFSPFQYYRLPVCYKEGPSDAALILHHRFSALRHEHKEMFDKDEVWPSEEQMPQLIRVVAGVFETVEAMIQFIDWEDDGGPKAHLETFLAYMVNSPSPSDERPYCALDHFYTRALSNIPPHLLSVFKHVFAITSYQAFPAVSFEPSLACLLSLGKDTLLTVLPHVYRLVLVKASVFLNSNPWITRFLEDPTRAAFLHLLRHASNPTAMVKLVIQWIQGREDTCLFMIDGLRQSACKQFDRMGDIVASDQLSSVSTLFRHFDFRCLAHCNNITLGDFVPFLRILYLQRGESPDIIRIEPINLLDKQFIDKCEGLAEPLGLEKMRLPQGRKTYQEWTLVHITNPKYVLLGFGDETVLAVLVTQNGYPYDRGVSIYTSAMLDYM
ncbi:hypothetical protein AGABI2DRAFT_142061 [Agaricus bisporus var. bisporus H97]|uniref:hypothetical protein n=1 Tax=Agaricus bisporus var. bisporus (strain H97 / ATCC MYA-4626 / FGSC 10389) TaxID=936046 RepID=UPI00029F7A43|nr:hypothetical protein AGABI2DRAFT_142061 [Agaricus bisporus var. bisporus H97]EKV49491.1 hypothetical protein AGABI2DRAFT_142061 [Agaricus bisporus var. bisporus H97]